MKLGTREIGLREYKHWRDKGVAFRCRESDYTEPNATFAASRLGRLHYWGDVKNPPFVGYGLKRIQITSKSHDEEAKNEHLKNEEEQSENKSQAEMPGDTTYLGDLSQRMALENIQTLLQGVSHFGRRKMSDCVRVRAVMSPTKVKDPCDIVYLGHTSLHLWPRLAPFLASDGQLLVEIPRYLVEQTKDDYLAKVIKILGEQHMTLVNTDENGTCLLYTSDAADD